MRKRFIRSDGKPLGAFHPRFEQLEPRWALSAVGLSGMAALERIGAVHAANSDLAGESFESAYDFGELSESREVSDFVGRTDARDVFRFEITSETEITIAMDNLSQDVDLFLYSETRRLIDRSTNGGSQAESIGRTLAPGTYYAAVDPYWLFSSNYRLSLTVPPPKQTPGDGEAFADVPWFGGQNEWNLNAINAPEAWAQGFTGEGIIAAVVDTGVDLTHPELLSSLWVNSGEIPGNGRDDDGNGFTDDTHGWDFANGDNRPSDQNGHGTHVAGTIAAANNGRGTTGVAPGITIMPVQVLNADGSGSTTSVAAGIRYAVDNGADLINLSLGGGFSSEIRSALEYAARHDVMVIAASGNRGATTPDYPAAHSAELANVLSVEAHTANGTNATFSNGPGNSVQVAAPGVDIYSTLPGGRFGRMSGTSMATPHVTGLAALALSANPSLTATQLRQILVEGANRSISGSTASGGVNAAAAVAQAASSISRPSMLASNTTWHQTTESFWRPLLARSTFQDAGASTVALREDSGVPVCRTGRALRPTSCTPAARTVDAVFAQLEARAGVDHGFRMWAESGEWLHPRP